MIRFGRTQALLAVGVAVSAAWLTVATTTRFADSATRLVAVGLVVFVMAVATGSRFTVGGGILIALIGAVIEIGTVPVQRWERSLAVACLWYLAAELAWDSMERRDGRDRAVLVTLERVREVGTVLVISLMVTIASAALVAGAPARSLVVLALTVGGLALALVAATRHLVAVGNGADLEEPRDRPVSRPSNTPPTTFAEGELNSPSTMTYIEPP